MFVFKQLTTKVIKDKYHVIKLQFTTGKFKSGRAVAEATLARVSAKKLAALRSLTYLISAVR